MKLSKADIGAPWELRASSFEAQMKLMKNFVSSSGAPREFPVLYGMDAAVKVISERFSVDLVPNVILMSELLAITHVTLYI